MRAIKLGAVDFLTKPIHRHELIPAVLAALARDREERLTRLEVNDIRGRIQSLTRRQYEVFQCVIAGRLNKQAASKLGITEKTIKIHRACVMEKMRVRFVAELVHVAQRAGVTMPS